MRRSRRVAGPARTQSSTGMSFQSPGQGFMRKMKRIFPNGLEGRSVMDCACNCGAYLLWCKELGAGECYGFDAREHWIRQARFLAEHRGQTDGVRFEVHDLYDLDDVDPGRSTSRSSTGSSTTCPIPSRASSWPPTAPTSC